MPKEKTKTEAQVRDPVIRWAQRKKILHMRLHMGFNVSTGWPDDAFFFPGGKVYFIEFKRPGGKVSKLQAYRIKKLRDLGFDVDVHDDTYAACSALAQRLRTHEGSA